MSEEKERDVWIYSQLIKPKMLTLAQWYELLNKLQEDNPDLLIQRKGREITEQEKMDGKGNRSRRQINITALRKLVPELIQFDNKLSDSRLQKLETAMKLLINQ